MILRSTGCLTQLQEVIVKFRLLSWCNRACSFLALFAVKPIRGLHKDSVTVPKRLSHTRKWGREWHGLVILLWFFSIPVLVVPADISRSWDWSVFLQIRCFFKCNSVGRLDNGVSCAVRCLPGAGQLCLVPVLFPRGNAGVFSFGALGRKDLFVWSMLQGHGNSAVLSAKNWCASKQ